MSYGLVWFKRDFRLADHGALAAAARSGPVLCVAIVEPAWAPADAARQHYEFMLEARASCTPSCASAAVGFI
jgi:deoxyribodipyrimidine photo-lyase family protein (cryptochrome)